MMRRTMFFLALVVLLPTVQAQLPQTPYDLGWFDHRDSRSEATGLGTLVRAESQVRSHPFQVSDNTSFKPETYDMIVFGSFSELHPSWDRFVQDNKSEILRWVREGGILVQMCRSRKSDRSEGLKLDLLPPGYEVFRGSEDSDEFHASDDLLPLWRGIHDEYKRQGNGANNPSWYRRPGGTYGKIEHGPTDAFERWSDQFTKSAGVEMRMDGGEAFAIHAKYGAGQILLFQLTFDKIDGAPNPLSQNLSKTFFSCLVRYGLQRPNPGKKKPEVVQPIEPQPVKPTRLRIEGRAFIDLDRDGRFDRDEIALSGLPIRDLEQEVLTDSEGRYSLERPINLEGFLSIARLPERLGIAGGWFEYVRPGKDATLMRDFAFHERNDERRSVVVASLPSGLGRAGVLASVESRLILAAKKERARRLVLFSGGATRAELPGLKARLEPLFAGDPGFELFFVPAPDLPQEKELGPRSWEFEFGGWVFGAESPNRPIATTGDQIAVRLGHDRKRVGSARELLLLPTSGSDETAAEFQRFVPPILDPEVLEAEPAYLVFEIGPEGRNIRAVPTIAVDVEEGPRLPLHRWGKGKMAELIEKAREEAKD